MASSNPKKGGDRFNMAKDGTLIPNDAGIMNTIPSKPRRGEDSGAVNANGNSLAAAASDDTDTSRSTRDIGVSEEVVTGTGDQVPATVESKRLHFGANNPLSKGHDRYDKHLRQKESHIERYATEGPCMDGVPGEENSESEELDKMVDSRERKQC